MLKALQDGLADLSCLVVRCPANGVPEARAFVGSEIPYAVFLFDEFLVGASGRELAQFALSSPRRSGTPAFVVKASDDVASLAERVRRLLGAGD